MEFAFLVKSKFNTTYCDYLLILTIFIFSVLVYSNTINGRFVWDDKGCTINNPFVQEVRNIPLFFTMDSAKSSGNPPGPYYRPMNFVFWTIESALWGQNPAGYHITNIFLHAVLSVLFFILCLKIVESKTASFFSALIFSVHPIHSENIAWISGGDYIFCAIFVVLSLLFYIRSTYGQDLHSKIYLTLSISSFVVAILSKEIALMVPLIIIAYEFSMKHKRPALKILVPFICISLLYLVIRGLIVTPDIKSELSIYSRVLTSSTITARYLSTFVFPYHLKILYDIQPVLTVFNREFVISIVILTVNFILMVYFYKKERRMFFASLWFLIFLLPATNIVFVLKPEMMSLRYLYISSMGLSMLSGLFVEKLFTRSKKMPVFLGAVAVVLLLCIKTFDQNKFWQNEVVLYEQMVKEAPNYAWARNNLGVAYLEAGLPVKAIAEFQRATELDPKYYFAFFNLGDTYRIIGRQDEAIFFLQRAVEMNPSDPRAYNSLGTIFKSASRYQEAIIEFNRALVVDPKNYMAHYNLANLLLKLNRKEEAKAHYYAFLHFAPDKYRDKKRIIENMLKDRFFQEN